MNQNIGNASVDDLRYARSQKSIYEWFIPLLCSIAVIAVVCNLIILLSLRFIREKVTANLKLIVSLSLADILSACLLVDNLLTNSYVPLVLRKDFFEGETWICVFVFKEMTRIFAYILSSAHLLALATNHFYSIFFPLRYQALMTPRKANLAVIFVWLVCSLAMILLYIFTPRADGLTSWHCHKPEFYFRFTFRIAVFLLFAFPLLLTLLLYTGISYKLRQASALRRKLSQTELSSIVKRKERRRTIVTLLLISGSYTLCWMPALITFSLFCNVGCVYRPIDINRYRSLYLNIVANSLIVAKFILNPFIYALRVQSIRFCLKYVYRSRCGRRAVPDEVLERLKSTRRPNKVKVSWSHRSFSLSLLPKTRKKAVVKIASVGSKEISSTNNKFINNLQQTPPPLNNHQNKYFTIWPQAYAIESDLHQKSSQETPAKQRQAYETGRCVCEMIAAVQNSHISPVTLKLKKSASLQSMSQKESSSEHLEYSYSV